MEKRICSLFTSLLMMISILGIFPVINTEAANKTPNIKTAYKSVIQQRLSNSKYDSALEYSIYDMDKNGVPELILNIGNAEASKVISIYTYQKGKAKLLRTNISGSHIGKYCYDSKNKKFVTISCHMGYVTVRWYTFSKGKIGISEKIFDSVNTDYDVKIKQIGNFKNLASIYYSKYLKYGYNGNKKISLSQINSLIDSIKINTSHKHKNKSVVIKSTYFTKGYTAKKCLTCGAIKDKKYTSILQMSAPKASVTSNSIKLTWNKISGAKGYVVYQKKSGKWSKIKTTAATSYTVTKLKSGTTYQFCIKPYTKSGSKTVYGNTSKSLTTSTKPSTVSVKVTAGSKKATLKWNKVTGASGYKIYYKTSKNGSWKLLKTVNNKTTSFTKTGLSSGKTYYFTVKVYKNIGKKTYISSCSKVISVKIKNENSYNYDLLNYYWSNNIQTPLVYKFLNNGTVIVYYGDIKKSRSTWEEYTRYKYSLSNNILTINCKSADGGYTWKWILKMCTKKDNIKWDKGLTFYNQINNSVHFWYETSFVRTDRPDNAMYLLKSNTKT